ncbi:MAG: PatB family C-S lyase [Bacteroidales bacterium]|nr:PatB family C-S lyase [Bacteroidales bacterium]MCF8387466.1 PatB family C-S lyase [Bacteroidales bacterium]MCF8398914.1 PatB family C-S lyase [Bacteroidales bacterium]
MHYNFDEIIPRASTNSVKYDLRKKIFGKEDVIPMWVADMDFATPDFIVDAVRERAKHPVFGYSFRSDDYFRSIINWQKRNHNWVIEKEWVRYSPGIVPALNFCVMAYTDPGDKIIVQPPVYFPFFSAIRNHGRVQVNNPLKLEKGRLNMDFDNLRKKAAEGAKMLFLCSPHNPGGSVWTQKELTEMVNICLDYNILIVSDEIHCDLVLPGYNHKPTATLSEAAADITITCIAPSKTFNLAGMATSSVIISNKTLQEKFDTLMEQLHVGMGNLFGAVASEAAYAKGERWLEELIAYIDGNVRFALDFFEKNIPGIKAIRPEATYMLWLDCRKMELDDEQLWKFFVEEAGVGMNKGESFGEGGEGFMRMNLACPRKTIKRALGRIKYAIDCHMNAARKK